jgi:hypothetical protein
MTGGTAMPHRISRIVHGFSAGRGAISRAAAVLGIISFLVFCSQDPWQVTWPAIRIYSIEEAPEGGYILSGGMCLHVGETCGIYYPGTDLFLMKINKNGSTEWTNVYCHGSCYEECYVDFVLRNDEGGYTGIGALGPGSVDKCVRRFDENGVFIGQTDVCEIWRRMIIPATGGCFYGLSMRDNLYLLSKLDPNLDVEWEVMLDENSNISSTVCDDGGIVIAQQEDGQFEDDISWQFSKYSDEGDLEWNRSFHGIQFIADIQATADGGYAVLFSNRYYPFQEKEAMWKLDHTGTFEWERLLSPKMYFLGQYSFARQIDDGGYILVRGMNVTRLAKDGKVEWVVDLGSDEHDTAQDVFQDGYGGFNLFGHTLYDDSFRCSSETGCYDELYVGYYFGVTSWMIRLDGAGNRR